MYSIRRSIMMAVLLTSWLGCIPGGDRPSGSVATGHPTASQTTTDPTASQTTTDPTASQTATDPTASQTATDPTASQTATDPNDNSATAKYFRREWSIHRANGTVAFEAPQSHDCKPLPETRPQDLSVSLHQRGYQPEDTHFFGLTDAPPCRFTWPMPWLDPPAASCRVLDGPAFDQVFAKLRKLDLHTIRIKHLTNISPHRGGSTLVVRWSSSVCEIADMLHSELVPADRARFDAAIDVFRNAYNQESSEKP